MYATVGLRKFGISIHAPRVGSDQQEINRGGSIFISIHAPRVGSDHSRCRNNKQIKNFNPRSPCGERPLPLPSCRRLKKFQSTLPVWGATCPWCMHCLSLLFQSTLPVWGATPLLPQPLLRWRFQSTLPVWGATKSIVISTSGSSISIHAPRVGSDSVCPNVVYYSCISIHAPRVGSDSK